MRERMSWGLVAVLILICILIFVQYNKIGGNYENSLVYVGQLEALTGVGRMQSIHTHADFRIYINGKRIDLNKPEFQAPEFGTLEFWKANKVNKFTHIHGGESNHDVMHFHATGITLGMFFRSIQGSITPECLKLPVDVNVCNNGQSTLKVFVNGQKIKNPENYEAKHLDKILISYGSEKDMTKQLESIGNFAIKHPHEP